MINILIPMAGLARFNEDEFQYPKPLIEIMGKPLIEWVIECFKSIKEEKRFIFVVNSVDCQKYYLDKVLRLITENSSVIIQLKKPTRGAVCSALMAIEHINDDNPLIISSSDQIIDINLNDVMDQFNVNDVDAGVICFESVHPKWSYVRLDENKKIIETAEKRPLSRNAIAGFYYFRRGAEFVLAAKKMIQKDAHVDNSYYTAPVMNEMVLEDKNLEIFVIPTSAYHNLYSPHRIKEYENKLKNMSNIRKVSQ